MLFALYCELSFKTQEFFFFLSKQPLKVDQKNMHALLMHFLTTRKIKKNSKCVFYFLNIKTMIHQIHPGQLGFRLQIHAQVTDPT
jgi:hypothetical protein